MLLILKSNIEVPKEALFKEVAKMLGYSRVSKETMDRMEPALEMLKRRGLGKEEGDNVVLVST